MEGATDPMKTHEDTSRGPLDERANSPAPSIPDLPPPVPEIEMNVLDDILQDQGLDPFSAEAR